MSIKDSTELCKANQRPTKERESIEDEVQLQE
jgi:hypothetical protein